jgi:hypothetical protein
VTTKDPSLIGDSYIFLFCLRCDLFCNVLERIKHCLGSGLRYVLMGNPNSKWDLKDNTDVGS